MAFQRPDVDEPHPAHDTPLDVLRGFSLGVVAGLRTTMPLALLARQIGRDGPDIADGGWVLDLFARRGTAVFFGLGTLGEFVGDKLPTAMSRLNPLPLIGRVIGGGAAGALQSLSEGRTSDRGALVGSLGAIAGSLGGYWFRTRMPGPPLLLALLEDAAALALGLWAVRH
jgi:uncharacterized membrane protein